MLTGLLNGRTVTAFRPVIIEYRGISVWEFDNSSQAWETLKNLQARGHYRNSHVRVLRGNLWEQEPEPAPCLDRNDQVIAA
jgi:hypothetical protein